MTTQDRIDLARIELARAYEHLYRCELIVRARRERANLK
jgi:hypothetical protein